MAKGRKTRRTRRDSHADRQRSPVAVVDRLLHLQTPDERPWRFLLPVLVLAFAVRAAIALCGDFVLHPDEVMQYLEPAHRLIFGSGVTYWEFFYGSRAWLVPGLVAGMLKAFDFVLLGEPVWYVGGVKLMFCAISLLIPVGMYFFARRHFGELSARVALLAGAFWYELVGFAHKPMTEFVAAALLMVLLVLCVRSSVDRVGAVLLVALIAVLAAAVRLQYAPIALLLLGVLFFRTEKRVHLVVAAGVFLLAVGLFDAMTWGGGLFHSYLTNIRFNLIVDPGRAGESPGYQFLWWLLLSSVGLGALCVVVALRDVRRYGFLLAMVALVVLIHSVQAHKEYRFVFAVVPLWLVMGADVVARFVVRGNAHVWGVVGVLFAAVSIGGVLNALPSQDQVYRGFSKETGKVGFVRGQDPIFAAYRYLARAPGVLGVWQVDRPYYNLPGYYYLHRAIPFYDAFSGRVINKDMETIRASVSHIVSGNPNLTIPGYSVENRFGDVQIWRRDEHDAPVRQWEVYNPIIIGGLDQIMTRINPNAPEPPPNSGIRFASESR